MVEEVRPTFLRLLFAMMVGTTAGTALGYGLLVQGSGIQPPASCLQNPDGSVWGLGCDLILVAPQILLAFLMVVTFGLAIGGAELLTGAVRVSNPLRWLLHSAGGGLLGGLFALLEGLVLLLLFQQLEKVIDSLTLHTLGGLFFLAGVAGMFGVGLGIAQLPLFERNKAEPLSAWVTNSGYSAALLVGVASLVLTLLGPSVSSEPDPSILSESRPSVSSE